MIASSHVARTKTSSLRLVHNIQQLVPIPFKRVEVCRKITPKNIFDIMIRRTCFVYIKKNQIEAVFYFSVMK